MVAMLRVAATSAAATVRTSVPARRCRSSNATCRSRVGLGFSPATAIGRMSGRRGAATLVVHASSEANDGSAPSISVEPKADDADTKSKKTDDEPVPNPPLRVAASSYLAFEKLTGGDVTCPLSGCQTALSSSYAELFGVPLSAYGAAAYGLTAALAWWGAGMAGDEELAAPYGRARVLFFLAGSGLAGVSSYLLYVLAGPLGGAECVYCLTSAAISFTLAAIGFSGLSPKETGRTAPAAVAIYVVTVLSLSVVLGGQAGKTNIKDLKLPYAAPVIEATSTQYSRDLAKHLKETGAKMYGAFWCSHCEDQKETFGAGADIPYVECFPNGWEKGTPLAQACSAVEITGFPTWILADGTRFEGEKTLEELAAASGYQGAQLDAASMAADFMASQ